MIYVFAGHVADKNDKDYDPGASGNGFREAELAVILRNKVTNILKAADRKVTNDNDGDSLKQVLAKTNSNDSDVILDIHWNASANLEATGTECFIPDRHTALEYEFAKQLVTGICSLTGLRSRGVKTETQSARKRLAIMRPSGINLLLEVCFITNKSDMEKYLNNIDFVAKVIAQTLISAEDSL